MALVRPVHHLSSGRVVHIEAVLSDHVALPVGLGGKCHWTLRALEGLLACEIIRNSKTRCTQIFGNGLEI